MKKINVILGICLSLFAIAGCKKDKEIETIKIAMPSGAPILSQLQIMDKALDEEFQIANYKVKFDIVNGADGVKAAITSKSHDVVVAPINLGATLFKNGSGYKYLANVTNGNLFFASTTKLESINDLNGKNLVLFGENTINDAVVNSILTKNNIEPNENITYLADTSKTQAELVADKKENTVYLVAEPVLSAARIKLKAQGKEVYVLDVQKEFSVVNDGNTFLQAGIFARENLDTNFIDAYLEEVKSSISFVNENNEEAAKLAAKLETGLPAENVLASAIPGCNLCFTSSQDAKDSFIYLVNLAPKYFGGEKPSEDFYY